MKTYLSIDFSFILVFNLSFKLLLSLSSILFVLYYKNIYQNKNCQNRNRGLNFKSLVPPVFKY